MTRLPPTEMKLDKATGRAYIRWRGTKRYFGKWGSMVAARAFSKWLATTVAAPEQESSASKMSIVQCVHHYLFHAQAHYSQNGITTGEFNNVRYTMDYLVQFASGERDYADNFGPLRLKDFQTYLAELLDENGNRKLARTTINAIINRTRRLFRWCVSQEFILPTHVYAMRTVEPLSKGRTTAREKPKVTPVLIEHVLATLPHTSPTISVMVRTQLLCGMRPQDVCRMTTGAIDRSHDIWVYEPSDHKTAHLDQTLMKAIPPAAQELLRPLLRLKPHDPLFAPADSLIYWRSLVRKTTTRPKRPPVRRPYSTGSYGRAVKYAIDHANEVEMKKPEEDRKLIPHWTPNQLRHAIATQLRASAGIEAAQLFLGHASANTTLIYAEQSRQKLMEIARQLVSPLPLDPTPMGSSRQ